MAEEKDTIIMECPLNYSLCEEDGKESAGGDANGRLGDKNLYILPKFGEPLLISHRDILKISEGNYKVHIGLTSKEKLTLSQLGYRFDDFIRVLSRVRNELILKDMLIKETPLKSGVEGEFVYYKKGALKQRGECSPRLYDHVMVIIPKKGSLKTIRFNDISTIQEEGFHVSISTDFGERYILSKMGADTDSFKETLSKMLNKISLLTQAHIKEMVPEANTSDIRRAARYLKDGKAARRTDIEKISPLLWSQLENILETLGAKDGYDFLAAKAHKKKVCIGLKKDLMGDLTGNYIWFLIPIYSTNKTLPGNAIAMEAILNTGAGKATYFFRIAGRKKYPRMKNLDELHKLVDKLNVTFTKCLNEINFRRKPIYLPDDKLYEPQNRSYKNAVDKLPGLRFLRKRFIGRVIHRSKEQWEQDVMELLNFNIGTTDNNAKWSKSNIEDLEDELEDEKVNDNRDENRLAQELETNTNQNGGG